MAPVQPNSTETEKTRYSLCLQTKASEKWIVWCIIELFQSIISSAISVQTRLK